MKKEDNRYGVDGKVLKVIRESINSRPLPKGSSITAQRREYLLNTPREELSASDKRLQSMILKYGSVGEAMAHRDRTNMVLGGYIGGKRRTKKGFALLSKDEVTKLARKGYEAAGEKRANALKAKRKRAE